MFAATGRRALVVLTSALALLASTPFEAASQTAAAPASRPALTAADYARAEKFLAGYTTPLVLHGPVRPTWIPGGGRFWYRTVTAEGSEFIAVDPQAGTKAPAFDHARLASALSTAAGGRYEAARLPFATFAYTADGRSLAFTVEGRTFTCDAAGASCTGTKAAARAPARAEALSPDGKVAAFIRQDNLWVRDVATGTEKPLTSDGVKDFGYATDNAGWTRSDRPVLLWSPDSRKIATFQQDQRGVGEMYLVETKVGRPTLHAWKYPLPGDEVVTTIQRVVIHLDGPRVVRLKMGPDQRRGTITDDIKGRGTDWDDVQWSADGRQLAFVSTSRDHKVEQFRVADPETGAVREIFEEKVATYFESGMGTANWRFLPGSNEVIWLSERDDWAHLYLYDLQTGRLRNAITSGAGNVTQVLRVDEQARLIYFVGVGREKGRDPYFRHLYRVGFDGKNLALLTPADADHDVTLSPSGAFFVDNFSRPDQPSTSVLRAADGREVLALEKADISKLAAAGWKPPIPFTVKADDGVTDLHGLLYRPTGFDASKKYPIVNNIYPGPQTGSVGSRSFSPSRGETQALAELGFVVVQIDGRCTPWRAKSFHASCYGNMEDNTLPDQIAGMKQLAGRFPWIDLDRVGIYGGSGGGYATAAAMFRYPEFFKVGVSASGNHDNRGYEDDWLEKWQGLLKKNPDGTTNYDNQANQALAGNLRGKLLLAHGTMDNNVPPYNTLLVVDALIKANRDFDLVLLPNRAHGLGEPYMIRRRWDYFVRHLLGAEPPREFEFTPRPAAPR
jgi:dipeptidyl aminopeptidase/acylaminoacyl peptidase